VLGQNQKKRGNSHFFLVSVSGVVGTDVVGQVVGVVVGWWLGEGGGHHHHLGMGSWSLAMVGHGA
jgi:hypothetical protein